jgi:alkaline phosphatase
LAKTYSANSYITDSAAGGTALATGNKTNNGMIGMNADSVAVKSILSMAEEAGLVTGLVATVRITHATPAAFYAHAQHRNERENIASWLPNSGIDVIFGGGLTAFTNRGDSINLMTKFKESGYLVIDSLSQADDITKGKVIGLFADEHLPSIVNGRGDALPKATQKALDILTANSEKSGKGFFMMVEGSQIDFESHANNAKGIYGEMKDFDAVVGVAFDYADAHPGTLVIVCADHDTGGMSIPSCKTDFTLGESGVEYNFGSTSHTATMTPALFYGTGADEFGAIIDNTYIAKKVREFLQNSF